MINPKLLEIEREIPSCPLFGECAAHANQTIYLSRIAARDPMRGVHHARILIVTQSPDPRSATGGAYRGGTGTRMMRLFLRPGFRICVDSEDYGRAGVPTFLQSMRIYQTSAVKCVIAASPDGLGARVVENCRRRFLDAQIRELRDLELIIPMGRLAIASVLHRTQDSVDMSRTIGHRGAGIISSDSSYGKHVIALPHPSGTNRAFNAPVIASGDPPQLIRHKYYFAKALDAIRERLSTMGYPLRPLPEEPTRGPLDELSDPM